MAAENLDAYVWAEKAIQSVDGHPFSINGMPDILEFYEDDARVVVAEKCAQKGLSVASLVRFMHKVANRGLHGIYFMPTDSFRNDFVQSRVNPLIAENPELQKLSRDVANTSIKQFSKSFAHFLGMKGVTQTFSTPADCLVFDEVDRMGEKTIEVAQKRLQNSIYKFEEYVSTPTFPNYGVNRIFMKSDQKYWVMPCTACGRKFPAEEMKFPSCIEPGYLACEHCGQPLDRIHGEWVPKVTEVSKDISGYHFTRLSSLNADYQKILTEFKYALNISDFYNQVLGLPYEDYESSVSEAHVLSLCGNTVMSSSHPTGGCTMGVDIGIASGKGKHVLVSCPGKNRLREVVYLTVIDRLEKLSEIITRFGVKKFVIDAGPQRDAVEDFVRKYRGKGWMCVYSESQKQSFKWDDETQIVSVNRTQSIDASQRILRESLVEIPRRCESVEEFAAHCASLARQNEQDPDTGIITPRWIRRGADDYRHAWNYDCLNWLQYGTGDTKAKGVVKITSSSFYKPVQRTGPMKLGW